MINRRKFYFIAGVICLAAIIWYSISSVNYHRNLQPSTVRMRLSKVDPSSYSTPEDEVIKNIDLEWNIDFERHVVSGTAVYTIKILAASVETIFLDVYDITIKNIAVKTAGTEIPVNYFVSDYVKNMGSKLTIELPTKTSGSLVLSIEYETSPKAAALQWLTPEQTLGKTQPYMYSQCQAIAARSLLPCQDTPAVKFTYTATVTHPKELTALLSAIRVNSTAGRTIYEQKIPVQSYLLAIAVGAIVSRQIGPSSKVWAEEAIVDEAAEEFSKTSSMLQTASDICGTYVWKEYDLLVMPPSFPFGGMENPCLTFVTPTLLAGDKSLTNVIAHEIAHSWTGNLVTNVNFEHFWLNEGFTTFVEAKIVGRLDGDLARDFHAIQGLQQLKDCIENQLADTPALTKLVVDLTSVSPDDAFSSVPYKKGATFLRYLEDLLGGPTSFEPFLRHYFNKYKYQSITSDDFKATLYEYYREKYEKELEQVDWDTWFYGEGMPPIIPNYNTTLADIAHKHANFWIGNSVDQIKKDMPPEKLTTLQKVEFLSKLNEAQNIVGISSEWIALLETTHDLNKTKNSEIQFAFYRLCVKARQFDRLDDILAFINSNFRMKFVRPIYKELGQWSEARDIAIANYNKVKDQMMAVCSNQVGKDLGVA
ncbi:leukotriene A-4 hydrolase isoform X2 [Bradysia coprophila]|uniref:leukotriene A-4 hydrolase isoform X2 n=1 Tax=Bradysia coprophila TaxID=38358 RepID=UPI00187D9790|nr:leukotriene A-4 hydrolase isoform X2 [Bradysia coprophila]